MESGVQSSVARASVFTAGLAAFQEFGQPTRRSALDGVEVFENEFWTAQQRQALQAATAAILHRAVRAAGRRRL